MNDVQFLRGTEYVKRFPVAAGVVCHRCGDGEVYQPGQTLDMPMQLRCLRCGVMAPSQQFRRPSAGGGADV